ncbi:hypothetical protein TTHERM_00036810 (macronuclear) [Tetrahymena thermophila SB210]|uniref:Uncharacterized protein n=1 Tax=Tetrahymena thermophila (strain SB210) TaxID=312017 RepID=Q22MD8_TETTS|nr:hypothetical protein TTHERM_00036810 [Tetrahymena thermophila SB210]EAR86294.1 hypothetical protein TTHERM_00036810 [Tetrahymena thermophila SB210]|eukprot:XP_977082.1 hypothetical protein TTHERM_00036810 [Tetrahymena thermophila SB210]
MSSQPKQSALNSVINIFLDIVSQKISEDELNTESSWSSMCDNISIKEVSQQQQQVSCSQFKNSQQISAQYSDASDGQFEVSKMKHNQLQNMIKNILKSFLKYLIKLQDMNTIRKYQSMYSKHTIISFSQIKKVVSKKVNIKANRWNFQLQSIVQSQKLKHIFYDYLIDSSESWLLQSKVSNTNEHQRLIFFILNCIENNQPLKIKTYKKKK